MNSKLLDFYKNKKVLVTGNTGFKGTWLTRILLETGAVVCGYSLEPPTMPNLYANAGFAVFEKQKTFIQVTGDIRDYKHLLETFQKFEPEIVFHLAAQPIVRESYKNPRGTYETNVMGTVNVCECIRCTESVKSFLNVTTDKVYQNREWCYGYRENDPLDGFDPYSNSKSCSELVTHSYINSFFSKMDGVQEGRSLVVSIARAGNVIGGGDFAPDRIIPDCVRAVENALDTGSHLAEIAVRNPFSTRPYQHVLEPLAVYLLIAARQYEDRKYMGFYNVGPDECDCVKTGQLVDFFCKNWNAENDLGVQSTWKDMSEKNAPHEANFLKLDCSLLKSVFGWKPKWHIQGCIRKTVLFSKVWIESRDMVPEEMDREIDEFFGTEE